MIGGSVSTGGPLALLRAAERQAAFALSQAINDAAFTALPVAKEDIRSHLTVRRDQVPNSIRVERASKGRLVAVVHVDRTRYGGRIYDALLRQEMGGTKRPIDGRHVAVPTDQVRRTKTDIVRKDQRPRPLLGTLATPKEAGRMGGRGNRRRGAKSKAFITEFSNGWQAIVRRDKTKTTKGGRQALEVLYVLRGTVDLSKRIGFERTVRSVVAEEMGPAFARRFAAALRTAR
jgi:hypothetical protein